MKCHILALLWKDKALGREKKEMQTAKSSKTGVRKKICSTLEWLAWSISLGNIGKESTKFNVKTHKTEDFGREHPLGLNILERGCILHMYFHLPFKIPGTSFHPLLPIGICSPLIICHLEKLCLNSLCICPLLSVYLWCLNMVLDIRAALHRSTETFPSPKMFQYPLPQNAYTK